MKEIHYYLADDGKKFDDRWECFEYEKRKAIKAHKDEFQFLDYNKEPIPIEEATGENIIYIIVKSDNCAEAISDWFNCEGCEDPFCGEYSECVGTWVYGETIDRSDEWLKLELEIEKLQTLLAEVNQ